MLEIRRGTAADFDEIIDFIDFVFSKNGSPHDFPAMYPNLYLRTDESMRNLVNLYEDGKIIGSVLAHERVLSVAGKELKVVGIGNVAAHPRMRGKGIMTKLMTHIVDEMKKDGVAISMLGGKRSRYNHFGYEVGGAGYGLRFGDEEVEPIYGKEIADKYTFRAFTADDKELASACKAIYETQNVHFLYNDDAFVLRFFDWSGRTPYAAYNTAGELIGYIALGPQGRQRSICEHAFVSGIDAAEALAAFAIHTQGDLRVTVRDWEMVDFSKLIRVGSIHSFGPTEMWNILDWKAVLEAFLTIKAAYANLENGSMVVEVLEQGKWEITVDGSAVTVVDSDKTADLTFSALDSVYAMTGPQPMALIGYDHPEAVLRMARSWFPLPLVSIEADRV
ncbi:MAG: GNAT family N-acetyltransferase [Clostridia bacterium]|nr:GNAT family N-acetyltransferase [Clostridia bacterium]